jgi:histidinol-phosphate/aromatic aminotransferase/cobyric acid decarboxylase-like protein
MTALRLHGDVFARTAELDFAVNIWPGPRPPALEAVLCAALQRPGYPDERAARDAVAERHGRDPAEVLLVNGAAEAFWLLAHALRPRRAACVHPGFTEPEAALRAAGCEVTRVFREPDAWRVDPATIPTGVELLVLGNPDNPTGRLEHTGALVADGRLLVVDESFVDFVPGERESLAHRRDVVVVRSLTKLWSLAGIRAGYVLAPAELVTLLEAQRQPWSVNALACAALEYCARDTQTPHRVALEVAAAREALTRALAGVPCVRRVWPGAANFLLLEVDDGRAVVERLVAGGIAVRPASSFPGLGDDHLRIAVRQARENERLVQALEEIV